MEHTSTHSLTRSQRDEYAERGYITLPGVFSADECGAMAREADRLMELVVNASLATGEVSPRLEIRSRGDKISLRKIQPINDISEALKRVSEDPRLVQPLADLLGCEPVLMEEKLNYKQELPPPITLPARPDQEAFPWHHDWAYFAWDGYPRETLSSALSIDATTAENGPIRVIPGSHLREDWPLMQQPHPYPDVVPEAVDESQAVDIIAPPGSVMIFHAGLVHSSRSNGTERPRRVMIYSHYPSTFAIEPDLRNRPLRERGTAHEDRYRELKASGQYTDSFRAPT